MSEFEVSPCCLEVARNSRFCEGAEWYMQRIKELEAQLAQKNQAVAKLFDYFNDDSRPANIALYVIKQLLEEWEEIEDPDSGGMAALSAEAQKP